MSPRRSGPAKPPPARPASRGHRDPQDRANTVDPGRIVVLERGDDQHQQKRQRNCDGCNPADRSFEGNCRRGEFLPDAAPSCSLMRYWTAGADVLMMLAKSIAKARKGLAGGSRRARVHLDGNRHLHLGEVEQLGLVAWHEAAVAISWSCGGRTDDDTESVLRLRSEFGRHAIEKWRHHATRRTPCLRRGSFPTSQDRGQ